MCIEVYELLSVTLLTRSVIFSQRKSACHEWIRKRQLFLQRSNEGGSSGTWCCGTPPLLRGYLTHAFFFFFIVLGANFQGEYSVYPSRTLTRILHYCLEQFGPVCFLSLTLWQPNGPATPQLLSTADIMCFWKPCWRGERKKIHVPFIVDAGRKQKHR